MFILYLYYFILDFNYFENFNIYIKFLAKDNII